jgi:hypothetical protein
LKKIVAVGLFFLAITAGCVGEEVAPVKSEVPTELSNFQIVDMSFLNLDEDPQPDGLKMNLITSTGDGDYLAVDAFVVFTLYRRTPDEASVNNNKLQIWETQITKQEGDPAGIIRILQFDPENEKIVAGEEPFEGELRAVLLLESGKTFEQRIMVRSPNKLFI